MLPCADIADKLDLYRGAPPRLTILNWSPLNTCTSNINPYYGLLRIGAFLKEGVYSTANTSNRQTLWPTQRSPRSTFHKAPLRAISL